MVNAIVLLKVKSDRINQVAEELAAHDGISEVYSVAGQYDLVAIIRAGDDDQIATLVTEQLLQVELMKSRPLSIHREQPLKHDLDGMFSVGMD